MKTKDWFHEMREKEFDNFISTARRADEFRRANEGTIRGAAALAQMLGGSTIVGNGYIWLTFYNATKKKVELVLEAVEKLGFPSDKWTSTETPETKNRTYTQTLDEVKFSIDCYFSGDSCRVVETGEETVVKKTFKLECDEANDDQIPF